MKADDRDWLAPFETSDPELVEALASVAGALPVEPAPARARRRLLDAVAPPACAWEAWFDKLQAFFDLDRAAVSAIAARAAELGEWMDTPFRGTKALHFAGGPAVAGADTGLVWVTAGTPFPRHRHQGEERTLILEGRLHRDDGSALEPGDGETKTVDSMHSYSAGSDGPLVYALVLYASIEIA